MIMKKIRWISLLSLIVFIPVQLVQASGIIPTEKSNTVKYSFLGFCVVFIAVVLATVFTSSKKNKYVLRNDKSVLCGILAAVSGLATVFNSIYNIYSITVLKNTDLTSSFISRNTIAYTIYPIIGLIAAMLMFIIAGLHFSSLNPFESHPLLILILPVWYCYGLIIKFIANISSSAKAENSLEILSLVFTLLFFLAQAKILSGIDSEKSPRNVIAYGTLAFIFLFATSVSYGAQKLLSYTTYSTFYYSEHIMDFCFAFYIFVFIGLIGHTKIMKNKNDLNIDKEINNNGENTKF